LPAGRKRLVYWPPVLAAAAASLLMIGGVAWLLSASAPRANAGAAPELALNIPGAEETKPVTSAPQPVVSVKEEPKPVVESKPVEEALPPAAAASTESAPVEGKLPAVECKPPTELLGTSVEFVDNPTLAARTAAREDKLLYVLHVSGNFEDPGFT
jgi:hypothetical protein